MIISKDFYDCCDPSYQKVIDEFEQKIANIFGTNGNTFKAKEEVISLIPEFAKTFFTPTHYWDYFFDGYIAYEYEPHYIDDAYIHFYVDENKHRSTQLHLLNFPTDLKKVRIVEDDFFIST
jgi:hypothetical protein